MCNRTKKVRRGLISLHISCLQFIQAHRHTACCKHTSNLHYQISECFHTGESEQCPSHQTCFASHAHPHKIYFIKAAGRGKIQWIYLVHHHNRHFLLPVVHICNHMNKNLVDVVSTVKMEWINIVWWSPVAAQHMFSFFFFQALTF